jgi:hypothetical protein
VISLIDSIYNLKTSIAEVKYPDLFSEKIKKIFNDDASLFAKALKQV